MQSISHVDLNHSKRPWIRFLALAALPLLLSGCFEISNARGQVQALTQERQKLVEDIAAYDKHIEYYKSILPAGAQIVGQKDPYQEALSAYVQRIEGELTEVKVTIVSTDSYLKAMREEASRARTLQPTE